MAFLTRAHRAGFVVAGLLLTGCGRGPTDISVATSRLQVHAVVTAGDTRVPVFVGYANGLTHELEPVGGVAGTVAAGEHSVDLAGRPGSEAPCILLPHSGLPSHDGCYDAVLAAGPPVGAEATITITTPAGEEVHGRVRIPSPVEVDGPEPTATTISCNPGIPGCSGSGLRAIGTITLPWISVGGAHWIDIQVTETTAFIGDEPVPDASCYLSSLDLQQPASGTAGTLDVRLEGVACAQAEALIPFDSVRAELELVAYDSAHAAYRAEFADGDDDGRESTASAALAGADGFFSGAARSTHMVVLRRVPAQ